MASSSSEAGQKGNVVAIFYSRRRARRPGMTTVEYFDTPETRSPRELAFGVLHAADAPSIAHQRLVGELFLTLAPFARARGMGEVLVAPVDVVLDAEAALVVQPDMLFVSTERSGIVGDRVYGAPDLVVEVLSPRPRVGSIDDRLGWFSRYGVRECWLVSQPMRQLVVLELDAGGVSRRTVVRPTAELSTGVMRGFRVPDWTGW